MCKTSYLSSLAYQARTWKFGNTSRKFSGQDLNYILRTIPSRKVMKRLAKTVNSRLTVSAKEIVHIMDSQSVAKAISTFRRLLPKAFPSMLNSPCVINTL